MHCIQCGKNVTSLSPLNLCEICDYIFQRNVQIVQDSSNIINTTKNTDTFINRCKIAIDALVRLKEFQHLNLLEPPPTQVIKDIVERRTDTIYEHLHKYYIELCQKLDSIDSIDRVIKIIEKAKVDFTTYKVYILNEEKLREINSYFDLLILNFIRIRLNIFLSDASDFEKQGNIKLALKKLKQALKEFELTKNYFPERDQDLDSELKEQIERLSSSLIK